MQVYIYYARKNKKNKKQKGSVKMWLKVSKDEKMLGQDFPATNYKIITNLLQK